MREAKRHQRRTSVLAMVLCLVLIPLAQGGLWYLSMEDQSLWYWLVGTPLCYFLMCGLGAFCGTSEFEGEGAGKKGCQMGRIASLTGAGIAALMGMVLLLWLVKDLQTSPPVTAGHGRLGPPGSVFVGPYLFLSVLVFVGINLLGITLGPLGGKLGGSLRRRRWWEWQSERERTDVKKDAEGSGDR